MNFSECDFPYLIPPQEVFDVQHDEYYIRYGEDQKSVRKIFAGVPYTDFEKQKLKEFEEMIKNEEIQLPPRWTTAYTMKYTYSAKFALDRCLEILKSYISWLAHPSRSKISERAFGLLKEGIAYLSGRDKQYRPVIMVNIYKVDLDKITIDEFIEALSWLLSILEKYCFVPGKVENWVIIIETNNASVWNFPFKILQRLVTETSVNFTSTLDKLYIMNPSRLLKGSWNLIQKVLHPETAAKISMVDKSEYSQLLEKIPIDQLEERYGGKLPNPETYWPPRNTLNKPPYSKSFKKNSKGTGTSLEIDCGIPLTPLRGRSSGLVLSPKSKRMSSPAGVSSVYYDFEEAYMDIPGWEPYAEEDQLFKGNSQKRSSSLYAKGNPQDPDYINSQESKGGSPLFNCKEMRGHIKLNKIPEQFAEEQNGIKFEGKSPVTVCCGITRDNNSESSCNIF